MPQNFWSHALGNGLRVVAERMPGVRSAAMQLLLPAGASGDPVGKLGAATVLSELVLRGAGDRDSRQLTDHLDRLGLQRSGGASVLHCRFGAAALAANVMAGLDAYADIVRRARLPQDGFAPAVDLALQALDGIDDEPRQKLSIKLREYHWPWPLGRNPMGSPEEVSGLTQGDLRDAYRTRFRPDGAILAVAGDVDFARLRDKCESLFGDWAAPAAGSVSATVSRKKYHFEPQQTEQTHIGLAYDAVDELHPDYYAARLSTEVLSGGMSGRLFTEIREKKALVYSVNAGYSCYPGHGAILGYAGTSNERAQQTLDQFLIELDRLSDGVTAEELTRAKTGLKSSTIMSGESSGARSGAIAHDAFVRGRLRTVDEIIAEIDAVTLDGVNGYLASHRPKDVTLVIVGPKELQRP